MNDYNNTTISQDSTITVLVKLFISMFDKLVFHENLTTILCYNIHRIFNLQYKKEINESTISRIKSKIKKYTRGRTLLGGLP